MMGVITVVRLRYDGEAFMQRKVLALWTSLQRAASRYSDRRLPGAHPAVRWGAIAVTLAALVLLVVALLPRQDEHASAAVFFGAVLVLSVAGALSWWAFRTPRKGAMEAPELRHFLENRAVILASMISRGASELAALHASWPEDLQVQARQQQNELLRHLGLWEQLEPEEQMLATSAQGCWTDDEVAMTYTWCEQLRLLRWVLGLDRNLAPLEEAPAPDWDGVRETLQHEFEDGRRRPLLAAWDVRLARDSAAEYTARVLAEYAHRGQLAAEANDTTSLLRWRNFIEGTSRDLQVGQVRIGDLDEESLQVVASIASVRWQYAAYLVDVLTDLSLISLTDWEAARMEDGAPIADGHRWQ